MNTSKCVSGGFIFKLKNEYVFIVFHVWAKVNENIPSTGVTNIRKSKTLTYLLPIDLFYCKK